MRPCPDRFIAIAVVAVALGAPARAHANGAFPDSENILTPADRPQEIVLVTNFGLVSSADGGQTWLWSCEQEGNALAILYQLTPLPRDRLLALANQSLVYSDDRSCGWQVAGGPLAGQSMTDVFVDPVGGARVMAVGVLNQAYTVYQSTDAGTTFAPLYQPPAGHTVNGVEFARSDPNVVYVALRSSEGALVLGRSDDGGAAFALRDVSADLGPGVLRIIAIDPEDPNRVLFRFLGANDQSVALTTDGGATITKPLTVNGNFTSFVRLPDGTLLVSGMVEFSTIPGLYRSRDRGATFEPIADPPSIRALSQREGKVYAATNNFGDGYAIGTSVDEGATWQPLMTYADVNAINPCIKAQCQGICDLQVQLSIWPAEVCSADPPPPRPPGSGGCCDVAGSRGAASGLPALLLLVLAARRRRRLSPPGAPPGGASGLRVT